MKPAEDLVRGGSKMNKDNMTVTMSMVDYQDIDTEIEYLTRAKEKMTEFEKLVTMVTPAQMTNDNKIATINKGDLLEFIRSLDTSNTRIKRLVIIENEDGEVLR